MATKHKSTPVRGIIIYVLLVIVTGGILQATGHFHNPFTSITSTLAIANEQSALENAAGTSDRSASNIRPEDEESRNDASTFEHPIDENKSGASAQGNSMTEHPAELGKAGSGTPGDTSDHDEAESIHWSRVGNVFFDMWFIALVVAVIIVVQQGLGSVIQWLKTQLRPVASR